MHILNYGLMDPKFYQCQSEIFSDSIIHNAKKINAVQVHIRVFKK